MLGGQPSALLAVCLLQVLLGHSLQLAPVAIVQAVSLIVPHLASLTRSIYKLQLDPQMEE